MELHDTHASAQVDLLEVEALEASGHAAAAPRRGREIVAGRTTSAPHYMHLNLGDWAEGTAGFSCEQEGFYLRVVRRLYACWGRIADDDARNARLFGIDIRVYRRLKSDLLNDRKIEIVDGEIINLRVSRDLDEIVKRIALRAEDGRKGPEMRKARALAELRPDFGPTYRRSPAEVHRTIDEKACDFNAATIPTPTPTPPPLTTSKREAGSLSREGGHGKTSFNRAAHVTAEWDQIAIDAGIPADRVSDQIDAMANFAAAKGQRYADWTARWRTWCKQYRPELDRVPGRQPSMTSLDDEVRRVLDTDAGRQTVANLGRQQSELLVRAQLESRAAGGTHA